MSEPTQKNDGGCARPKPFCCILRCLFIAALVFFAIHFFCHGSHATASRRLWMPVIVEADGKQTVLGETRQMEFWTPSAKTRDYLHMEDGAVVAKEKWEAIPDDAAVLQFGSVLHSNQNVLGYRRVEVWGQGRTNFKPGWWWTMTVLTNFSVGDLSQSYQGYWKSQQPVFIEVIDNRGSDD